MLEKCVQRTKSYKCKSDPCLTLQRRPDLVPNLCLGPWWARALLGSWEGPTQSYRQVVLMLWQIGVCEMHLKSVDAPWHCGYLEEDIGQRLSLCVVLWSPRLKVLVLSLFFFFINEDHQRWLSSVVLQAFCCCWAHQCFLSFLFQLAAWYWLHPFYLLHMNEWITPGQLTSC